MKTSTLLILSFAVLIVSCKKEAKNSVPVVNAGSAQTITLPTNGITLNGVASDADGQIAGFLWSQVSGPYAATIQNPASPSTIITGFVEGDYVFQLMATDDLGATGVGNVLVKVNPAAEQTITIQPSNNPNEKMLVTVGGQDQSFQAGHEWVIDAWTVNGATYIGRKLVKFDLSSIPSSSTIVSAHLFLYSNNPPLNGNYVDPNFGINNSLVLQQVTSDWTSTGANWYNQPQTTTTNQILVPHTTASILDLNLDVTQLISSMIKPNSNFGFLMKLQNETVYNSRMFVSSYHPTKLDKHPKLVITYK